MRKSDTIKILSIIITIVLLSSCRTTKQCPERLAIGNTGSVLNTKSNDNLPTVFGDKLYFTTKNAKNKYSIFVSELKNDRFTAPYEDRELPTAGLSKIGATSFWHNKSTGENELYFAGVESGNRRGNRVIFRAVQAPGQAWGKAEILKNGISTDRYESHPCIAPDGSLLLFSSDRKGGYGGVDLYISYRQKDGSWSQPANLGPEINTANNEISPFIADNGMLYFASSGYLVNNKMDIVRAKPVQRGVWHDPKALPFPINTEYSESGPTIWGNKLIISSDRRGGCGGIDIYSFDLCGPVFISGKVVQTESKLPLEGKVELLDIYDENVFFSFDVDENGEFEIPARPEKKYLLKYTNSCMPDYPYKKYIMTPCSDSSTVKILVKWQLDNTPYEFSSEAYNVPFFTTGYYIPNTMENLEALRMKFTYNLLGTADSVKYIPNPVSEVYDKQTAAVEEALTDLSDYVRKKLNFFKGACSEGNEKLLISIKGYTDPRRLSSESRYSDPSVLDRTIGIDIKRGEPMTNELLAKLRAYYTALEIHKRLSEDENFSEVANRIKWIIIGAGADTREGISDETKRRVDISVSLEK